MTKKELMNTPEYMSNTFDVVVCPICGELTLNSFYVCNTCGWEYDSVTEDNEYSSANKSTVRQYRDNYVRTTR